MIANGLTGLRFLLIGPTAIGFARPDLLAPVVLLSCVLLAIATDYFDGVIARRTGTASAGGQLLDHGTDFLFVTAGLAGAAYAGLLPPLLPLLIVIAFSQYLLDSRFLHRERRLRTSFIGRWNGILYFVPLLLLATARLDGLAGWAVVLAAAAHWLAWLLVASTLVSIVDRALAPWRTGPRNDVGVDSDGRG